MTQQHELNPDDYYTDEHGRVVFTAAYHRRRGSCCGNGCMHCPWPDHSATDDAAGDQSVDSNALT